MNGLAEWSVTGFAGTTTSSINEEDRLAEYSIDQSLIRFAIQTRRLENQETDITGLQLGQ